MAYAQIVEADVAQGKSCKATAFAKQIGNNWLAMAGMIMPFAGSAVPTGWLDCTGQAVSRTTYADLFAAIGTTWGVGDGSTTFNVPDLRGRMLIGAGTGSGLTARTLAATGGVETHPLTTAEIASHYHMQNRFSAASAAGQLKQNTSTTPGDWQNTDNTGSGTAHNNMPPYKALYWLIKT